MKEIKNFINGEFCSSFSSRTIDNYCPASGEIYGRLPNSNLEDLNHAVEAAQAAYPQWMSLSAESRANILLKIADEIDYRSEELALAESIDNGKLLSLAKSVDIPRSASNFRFFAHAITQFSSESHSMGDLGFNYTLRDPLGVVACISPWNLPLYLLTWKLAPALATGNCVIAKPSELTPVTAHLLGEICQKAGLPKGVLSILHGLGSEIGNDLSHHKDIKAISFTGGTKTGQTISSVAAPMFKKLSLEMGGKNPTLIFDDCHFDEAVEGALRSAFTNQGEICLCGSRIYCQKNIYDKFVEAFARKTKEIVVGDPLEETSQMGALISKQHMNKVLNYIEIAKAEGAHIEAGGEQVFLEGRCKNGFFVAPTVFTATKNSCTVNQEEIFGPVVSIQSFEDEAEAVKLANDSEYGLSSSIWSTDVKRCHRVAKQLDAGILWLNSWMIRDLRTPFGGVKQSGVGREGGLEALRFFSQTKNIFVKY